MSEPLKVGLIGVGRWGKVYINTLLSLPESFRLTSIATSNSDNQSLIPYPVNVHKDWIGCIEEEPDLVIVATPPSTHAEILKVCIDTDVPVIVEKPLCMNVEEAEELLDAADENNAQILVNHLHLFNPWYQSLKQKLTQQAQLPQWIVSEGMSLGPFREHSPSLWDWAAHDVSLILDLMQAMPQQAQVLAGPRLNSEPEQWSVRLDFDEERCGWVHVGRLAQGKRRQLSVFTQNQLYRWDEWSKEHPLTVSDVDLAKRYAGGFPEKPTEKHLDPLTEYTPMQSMLIYMEQVLRGGDETEYMGLDLAVQVVRILDACAQQSEE